MKVGLLAYTLMPSVVTWRLDGLVADCSRIACIVLGIFLLRGHLLHACFGRPAGCRVLRCAEG